MSRPLSGQSVVCRLISCCRSSFYPFQLTALHFQSPDRRNQIRIHACFSTTSVCVSGFSLYCFNCYLLNSPLVFPCSAKVDECISRSSTYITKLLLRPQSPKTFSSSLINAPRLSLSLRDLL